jgi:8-oxo-dGTP diphosphatase
MSPEPTTILGCGVAIIRNGKILLSQRLDPDKPGHGLWAMPGGKVDPGECPAVAAEREVLEETGLKTVTIMSLPGWYWTDKWADHPWITLYFAATVAAGEPINTEPRKHSDWKWFDPYDLPFPLWDGIEGSLKSLGLLR